jgi:hypothetical protein
MIETEIASAADFDRMAEVLLDLAMAQYCRSPELSPKLVVMGRDTDAAAPGMGSFSLVPVAELSAASGTGMPPDVMVATLIEKLSRDPGVLVVGHMAEAWRARYTVAEHARFGAHLCPEDAANREEVLLLCIRSSDCTAVKTCALTRNGRVTTLSPGELVFKPRPRTSRPLIPRLLH